MLFNSWQFLLFFPIVVGLCFAVRPRLRWALLLGASYFFYMCWEPAYLALILISTLVDYLAARGIAGSRRAGTRKALLGLSIFANLGLLFSFKYFNFASENLARVFGLLGLPYAVPSLAVLLPVGISFYTFQTLSYTIEVYRGRQQPERHLGYFSLYVAYFPQLVAGPIERPYNLLPQLHARQQLAYARVADGLRLMAWGMFKKVVIADRLAILVDRVYAVPEQFSGFALALATVFFAFQIYCDFSGYSDIAIGAAEVLGHRLMDNFDRPYFASSIADFWRRWHISLSTWFRDYVFVPLGGSRVGTSRLIVNILVVFTVSGLWHGANWTFFVWGALHGFYYVAGRLTRDRRETLAGRLGLLRHPHLRAGLQRLVTFGLVSLAWVFFRADSIADAGFVLRGLSRGWQSLTSLAGWQHQLAELSRGSGPDSPELLLSVSLILLLLALETLAGGRRVSGLLANRPAFVRWPAYVALILSILNLGVARELPFIYFQF